MGSPSQKEGKVRRAALKERALSVVGRAPAGKTSPDTAEEPLDMLRGETSPPAASGGADLPNGFAGQSGILSETAPPAALAAVSRGGKFPSALRELRDLEPPAAQAIAERAYFIWIREGKPEGRAACHWLQAEDELEQECRLRQAA